MCPVYGDKCFTRTAICVWCKKFAHDREIVVDEEQPGRRVVLTTDAMNAVTQRSILSRALTSVRRGKYLNEFRRHVETRSPASAGIANRPLVFATRTTLSGHNIEYLCLNLFTLRRFNNNESSGGRQIRFCPY